MKLKKPIKLFSRDKKKKPLRIKRELEQVCVLENSKDFHYTIRRLNKFNVITY